MSSIANNYLDDDIEDVVFAIRNLNFGLRYLSDEAKKSLNKIDDGTIEELIDELNFIVNPESEETIKSNYIYPGDYYKDKK